MEVQTVTSFLQLNNEHFSISLKKERIANYCVFIKALRRSKSHRGASKALEYNYVYSSILSISKHPFPVPLVFDELLPLPLFRRTFIFGILLA